jgi:hypothetical protein
VKKSGCGTENFFLTDNPIIPNFHRKQGNKVILMRKEKGKREKDCLLRNNELQGGRTITVVLGMQSPGDIELNT